MKKKVHSVSIKIKAPGNTYGAKCVVDGSVRGHSVSLSVRGGDQWAHLSREQAIKLSEWLLEAVSEIDYRKGNLTQRVPDAGDSGENN